MKMGVLQRQAILKAQQQCQTHMHHVTSLLTYEEGREKVRRIRDRLATMKASNRTALWSLWREIETAEFHVIQVFRTACFQNETEVVCLLCSIWTVVR